MLTAVSTLRNTAPSSQRFKSANQNADGTVDNNELASLAGRLLLVMVLP